jgi:antitoxin YokJ
MDMPIAQLIKEIQQHPDCAVYPPSIQMLELPKELVIPNDLLEFYKICNGLTLFKSGEYTYRILGIEELLPLNRIYDGECFCGEEIISTSWYFVAENWNRDKIAIDTHPLRLGRCYDCFVGEGYPVIAQSFEELLFALYRNNGEYTYWLKEGFSQKDPCSF